MPRPTKRSREARVDRPRRSVGVNDPQAPAIMREILRCLLSEFPEIKTRLVNIGVERGLRRALRRVLARRGLRIDPLTDISIDVCKDRATLRRWLDQAVTAPSAVQALK